MQEKIDIKCSADSADPKWNMSKTVGLISFTPEAACLSQITDYPFWNMKIKSWF